LQFWLKKPFSIIPMIVGGESARTSKCLAETLGPYFNENNLFVVSTDFSHYPPYKNACVSDKFMADAIALNDVKAFLRAKSENESGIIPNLMTAMCGWTSVLTLLNITEKDPDLTYTKILYKNSGDSPYGDKDRVVGYCSFGITKKTGKASKQDLSMADEEKSWLLRIARESLEGYFKKNKFVIPSECQSLPGLRTRCGAFVTLKENGKLRGCIGNMHSDIPLCELVRDLTVAAATRDFRFDPVNNDEMQAIEIEISILGPMRKITTIEEIQLGKHGIYIRNGNQTGTFLPQVAVSTGWTVNEFLGHCARDKALIGWNGWKEAEIYIYETLCFCEREHEHLVN
ncbi:MAG TPA: AmmeMemoRadiSam system protein A, partial [Cyclobacteriaceae bacterium]|nr:AmmeMemoRadiSam system protein A [Cyclobacteriaceae bacterium]